MKRQIVEGVAVAGVLLGLAAAAVVPVRVEASRRRGRAAEVRTIELTGIMGQGLWTDEEVAAASAWRRDFRRARPQLRLGETVRLRLASADVVHAFAAPDLGVDRVEVYPGKVTEVLVTPSREGTFEYYCTTVCGEAHFAMRGFVEVLPSGGNAAAPPAKRPGAGYWLAAEPPAGADRLARGAWLYRQQGCVTCHGEGGAGGVLNPNSMNATVPGLRDLARRTFLFTAADTTEFLSVLEKAEGLEALVEAPSVPLFAVVRAQYLATRRLVRNGRRSVRLDPAGPRPPLDMPAWRARLSAAEIDSILAYLITQSGGDGDDALSVPHQTSSKGATR